MLSFAFQKSNRSEAAWKSQYVIMAQTKMMELLDKINILVAENNAAEFKLVATVLRETNIPHQLFPAADGKETLHFLTQAKEETDMEKYPRPHLILLDLGLPKMSGLEVLKEIKKDPELKPTPVVILSNSEDPNIVKQAYKLGAASYIPKPGTLQAFEKAMDHFLHYWLEVSKIPYFSPRRSG
jgi:CheY-like chemotaxis protein